MGFVDEFKELAQETVVWERAASKDSYGAVTYAAPVVFSPDTSPGLAGHRKYQRVRRSSGGGATPAGAAMDYIQGSVIWLLTVPGVQLDDLVYVAGDPAPYPPILSVEEPADETGQRQYTKITLGSAV